jgi:hypothetical protein
MKSSHLLAAFTIDVASPCIRGGTLLLLQHEEEQACSDRQFIMPMHTCNEFLAFKLMHCLFVTAHIN